MTLHIFSEQRKDRKMASPKKVVSYGEASYWDKRYERDGDDPFDWLFSYDDVKLVIKSLFPSISSSMLLVGCGNAPFSIDM
jgi:hypothetical protein